MNKLLRQEFLLALVVLEALILALVMLYLIFKINKTHYDFIRLHNKYIGEWYN
jgi:hypothetical protein